MPSWKNFMSLSPKKMYEDTPGKPNAEQEEVRDRSESSSLEDVSSSQELIQQSPEPVTDSPPITPSSAQKSFELEESNS